MKVHWTPDDEAEQLIKKLGLKSTVLQGCHRDMQFVLQGHQRYGLVVQKQQQKRKGRNKI